MSATNPFPVHSGGVGIAPPLLGVWPTWDTAHAVLITRRLVLFTICTIVINPLYQGNANDTCPSYSDDNGIPYVCHPPFLNFLTVVINRPDTQTSGCAFTSPLLSHYIVILSLVLGFSGFVGLYHIY